MLNSAQRKELENWGLDRWIPHIPVMPHEIEFLNGDAPTIEYEDDFIYMEFCIMLDRIAAYIDFTNMGNGLTFDVTPDEMRSWIERFWGERRITCGSDDVSIRPNGIDELDPCMYRDTESFENVTVVISECERCGRTSIGWRRQDNTKRLF